MKWIVEMKKREGFLHYYPTRIYRVENGQEIELKGVID